MVDIPIGTDSPDYTLVPADLGATIYCRVTATNVVASASVNSNVVGPVAALAAPIGTTAPSISDTPTEGVSLSVDPGEWNGNPTFSYEWHRTDAVVGVPPFLVTTPSTTPEPPTEDVELTCTTGIWSGDPTITFSYEWHKVTE